MATALLTTSIPDGRLVSRGKVRDIYAADGRLLLVATDRISAYDCVLRPGVPGRGVILTQLSSFWFERLADVVPSHVVSGAIEDFPPPYRDHPELARRTLLVRRLEPIPIECVVRGYLAGSGWTEYRESGRVCGIDLPPGLVESARLPAPIFTPATKATNGHDENISFDRMVEIVGGELAERLRSLSLTLYDRAFRHALERGVIIADTKLELGLDDAGGVVWIDEAFTPDSSRFWPADDYRPGGPQPSFDKQFVRDWLSSTGWDREPPAPELPPEVVEGTLVRYRRAYQLLTDSDLDPLAGEA